MVRVRGTVRIDHVRRIARFQRAEARRQRDIAADMRASAGRALQRAFERHGGKSLDEPPSAPTDGR